MARKKLILIDSYGFIFRAFYSLPPLIAPDGTPVGAVFGFVNMLQKVQKNHNADYIAAVFDAGGKNFRHKIFPDYKANRPPAPLDLIVQFPLTREAAEAMSIAVIEKVGFEADDVIATLARRAEHKNIDVVIISSDKDLMQLVSDHISLYDAMKNKMIKHDDVVSKFGVPPEQLLDFLSLVGDSSDNIPGVAGIGAKTAALLLAEYGSLDNLLDRASEIKQQARCNALISGKKSALISRELARLDENVTLCHSTDDLAKQEIDLATLQNFARKYNFKSLMGTSPLTMTANHEINLADSEELRLMHYISSGGKSVKKVVDCLTEDEQAMSIKNAMANAEIRLKQEIFDKHLNYVYYCIDRPLLPVLRKMEQTGILVDPIKLIELSAEFTNKIRSLTTEIYNIAGEEFNINSSQQLAVILFEKMGLATGKKGAAGAYSTNVDILTELAMTQPIAELILQYRHYNKLKNTYTDALPREINETTGRIHSSFSNMTTITGRLSSTKPNLQNIPTRTDDGNRIRKCFGVPRGYKMISADYSQIELRMLAEVGEVDALRKAFALNQDIHQITASEIFKTSLDQVTAEQRQRAKAINFGIIYGVSAFGLAKNTGITRSEAANYIANYFRVYPGIKDYMESTISYAHSHGYVTTIFGRRCNLGDINSNNAMARSAAERLAINARLQGSAADIIKKAMIEIDSALMTGGYNAKMILQIHDELLIEVQEDQADSVAALLSCVMEKAHNIVTPLKVDVTISEFYC